MSKMEVQVTYQGQGQNGQKLVISYCIVTCKQIKYIIVNTGPKCPYTNVATVRILSHMDKMCGYSWILMDTVRMRKICGSIHSANLNICLFQVKIYLIKH